ncbi:MAG: hypothetical protein CL917_17055 [Deltaproteobacteria bacterium]|nr:hypothetical protein [Deltaproteobacteria bacterium]
MNPRTACWLIFITLALTVPLPLLGPFPVLAPAVRYLLLATVTSSVALVEGASGPVPLILLLFAVHALVYLVLEWLVAALLARSLSRLTRPSRRLIVLTTCGFLFLMAITFNLYHMPFGTNPKANLFGLLS